MRNTTQNSSVVPVSRMRGNDFCCRVGVTFPAGSTTAEVGFLTLLFTGADLGSTSGINGGYLPIAPGLMGKRAQNVADLFSQYRLKSVTYRYRPNMTTTNTTTSYTTSSAGPAVIPSVPSWDAVVGVSQDPVFGGSYTASEALSLANAKIVDLAKPWSITFRPSQQQEWKYMNVPINSVGLGESNADLRSQFAGVLVTLWSDNTAAGAFPFTRTGTPTSEVDFDIGTLWTSWDFDFRYPQDPDVDQPGPLVQPTIAYLRLSKKIKNKQREDEKKEDSVVKVVPRGGSYFGF